MKVLVPEGLETKKVSSPVRSVPSKTGIQSYTRRWGSCHIDGWVYFNWRIIMAPHIVIDYVVAHELCHLVQHNHSIAFWNLVESLMPDYRAAKNWLKLNRPALGI